MSKDVVSNLVQLFDDRNTLVVGPALEGHEFKEGARYTIDARKILKKLLANSVVAYLTSQV
jgi:hypothetical protein